MSCLCLLMPSIIGIPVVRTDVDFHLSDDIDRWILPLQQSPSPCMLRREMAIGFTTQND